LAPYKKWTTKLDAAKNPKFDQSGPQIDVFSEKVQAAFIVSDPVDWSRDIQVTDSSDLMTVTYQPTFLLLSCIVFLGIYRIESSMSFCNTWLSNFHKIISVYDSRYQTKANLLTMFGCKLA
jgi:hypothetical protein